MAPRWRLIVETEPSDGAWSMALDRAIQTSRARGETPPTLRIYGWMRPTVTFGRFQDAASVDLDACRRYGVDVVRRFTGGRGVLHDDEVTYSVVAATADGVPRGTSASYRHLCTALVEAYGRLGLVDASLTHRPRGSSASVACYLHATSADLSVGIRKLSGSAQVWMGDTVLQHGSLTMTRDVAREAEVFGLTTAEKSALSESTATLEDCLADTPSREVVRAALAEGFSSALEVDFDQGGPTASEIAIARGLLPDVTLGTIS